MRYTISAIMAAVLASGLVMGLVLTKTSFNSCTDLARQNLAMLCVDAASVNRDAIHAQTVEIAAKFFADYLR